MMILGSQSNFLRNELKAGLSGGLASHWECWKRQILNVSKIFILVLPRRPKLNKGLVVPQMWLFVVWIIWLPILYMSNISGLIDVLIY